jgi:SAM-dependent methyltransferase
MADIETNRELWGKNYSWDRNGDEWSDAWGGQDIQWYGTLLPRIQQFVPVVTILEIAPGFGRWSKYLIKLADNLFLVDLAEKCIEHCKKRFESESHIKYYVNDGKSLDMIKDYSIDFVFSYDSLVHVELDVMQSYLRQISKKLTTNGVAFLHHSNIGTYKDKINEITSAGIDHGRAFSVTAGEVWEYAKKMELVCIGQEILNWGGELLTDCITTCTKKGFCL